jgi:uncharacterized 2Fe-2S/4Fe-4S cluster protein (DUF4445 family)
MAPLIVKKNIELPQPTDNDRRADDQRIKDILRLDPLAIPLSVLKKVPGRIKAHTGALSCIVGRKGNGYTLIDIESERSYSLVLDLGTTNLVFLLYDNVSQTNVLSMSFENPQILFGSDILTRMHHAMSIRADEVYGVLKDGINRAVRTLCERGGIATRDVHAFVVAGNTVMSHFFLGLDISTIPVDPFVPVVRTPGFFTAAELALDMHAEALVYVFPNAGSYVGGDIVAGIIASGMHRDDRLSVLIDVGTNAEIVIGNKDWMLVGAGAAGPALEEGISRIGKRASKGIIYDIEIKNGAVSCTTFDEHTPEGICGSGMVSLLYELYNAGIIDKSGSLNLAGDNVTTIDDEPAYAIACGCSEALYIRQSEIQNFMKSKAAMFTLLLVLLRSVGIAFKDIESVYVSGALGTGIRADKAVAIGMLPAWPPEIVKPLGNTSLGGARMLLNDGSLVQTIDAVTAKITYKHMHDDPEFMKEYLGAVFIPHTNPELLKAT